MNRCCTDLMKLLVMNISGLTPAGEWLLRDLHRQPEPVVELANRLLLYLAPTAVIQALVSEALQVKLRSQVVFLLQILPPSSYDKRVPCTCTYLHIYSHSCTCMYLHIYSCRKHQENGMTTVGKHFHQFGLNSYHEKH